MEADLHVGGRRRRVGHHGEARRRKRRGRVVGHGGRRGRQQQPRRHHMRRRRPAAGRWWRLQPRTAAAPWQRSREADSGRPRQRRGARAPQLGQRAARPRGGGGESSPMRDRILPLLGGRQLPMGRRNGEAVARGELARWRGLVGRKTHRRKLRERAVQRLGVRRRVAPTLWSRSVRVPADRVGAQNGWSLRLRGE